MFDVPNLGALNDAGELNQASNVLRQLSEYAHLRAIAVTLRKDGFVYAAFAIESRCDQNFNALPKWAKW